MLPRLFLDTTAGGCLRFGSNSLTQSISKTNTIATAATVSAITLTGGDGSFLLACEDFLGKV